MAGFTQAAQVRKVVATTNDPIGLIGDTTAIDYNPAYQDGSLHIRKGWAGR